LTSSNSEPPVAGWRALNFERAPFDWGRPVELVNENCTEAGGWRDKSLGVWRLGEIPYPPLEGRVDANEMSGEVG
jgi:hypothetical protein